MAVSAGARVIDEVIQRRDRPDPATYIGKGKVEELREEVLIEGVDVVIFDQELSPSQAKNLEEALETKVVDRTGLILDIFARRARTKEGKLRQFHLQLTFFSPRTARKDVEDETCPIDNLCFKRFLEIFSLAGR